MPSFLECPYCQRLYSRHSLGIHEKTCGVLKEKVEEEKQNRQRSKSARRRKSKRQVVDHGTTLERPRTQSLSRFPRENELFRICFVCGGQFDDEVIEKHKEKCFEDWTQQAEHLLDRFHLQIPHTLNVPSIDGTIDVTRENQRAAQSSQQCQLARCRCCNARIALQHAKTHQCVRFEPTIEFYF